MYIGSVRDLVLHVGKDIPEQAASQVNARSYYFDILSSQLKPK